MKNIRVKIVIASFIFLLVCLAGCKTVDHKKVAGVLVSSEWLHSQAEDTRLVILHVGTQEIYDSIHIPGARFLDPYDFTVTIDSLRNQIPELPVLVEALRSVGINQDSRIVLYYEDEDLVSRTARVFMTLDFMGLGERGHVLNGGLTGWVEAALPTSEKVLSFEAGNLVVDDVEEVVIKADELNQQRWNPDFMIIDSRSQEEYYGELDSTGFDPSGGHIEGAYLMNYESVLSDATPHIFRENSEILEEYKRIGMDQRKTAVYYCGSGIRASTNYLIARHLGYPALLYDGSIEEWEELGLPLITPVIDPEKNP